MSDYNPMAGAYRTDPTHTFMRPMSYFFTDDLGTDEHKIAVEVKEPEFGSPEWFAAIKEIPLDTPSDEESPLS